MMYSWASLTTIKLPAESLTFKICDVNVKDSSDSLIIIREAQECIIKEDQTLLVNKVLNYPFLYDIAASVGWKKLWDHALDHSSTVIKSMKNLVRVITYPDHAVSKCPLCDISKLDQITLPVCVCARGRARVTKS